MKQFLVKTAIFFCFLFAIDVLAGYAFAYMVNHAKGGDNGRNNYICNLVDADVLVFGSSRAIHHYNPQIIADSLALTCYNCGQDGNGSILNYGRYQLICRRYHPKVVIYDLMPKYDLLLGEDNHRFLGWLRSYYDRPGIAPIFEDIDSTEKIKMMCKQYRYNTKFIQIVSDYIHPLQNDNMKGFRPLHGEMDMMRVSKQPIDGNPLFDSKKIEYLKKMLYLANKQSQLVVVVSPIWRGMNTSEFEPVRELCQANGIPFLDYSNNPEFLFNNNYFCDGVHLNIKGANRFTEELTKRINNIIYNDKDKEGLE